MRSSWLCFLFNTVDAMGTHSTLTVINGEQDQMDANHDTLENSVE